MAKKTAIEKLHSNKGVFKIDKAPEQWGGGTMYIAYPLEVDEQMKRVPKGKIITKTQIRKYLAFKHDTDICCPLTTGIFTNISAAAAEEERAAGKKDITPWWRTVKDKGELNEKSPGGLLAQKELLEQEGIEVYPKGKKLFIKDFEKYLFDLIE